MGGMVVTRTIMDGRTDTRTMAAGSSMTWTHCSVRYEVTWNKKARVRADAPLHPRKHRPVYADEVISLSPCPHPPSALRGRAVVSARTRRGRPKKIKIIFFFGCWLLEKRGKKCSVFNPQDPRDPRVPRAARASWAKPREEEGFFGLVPLVTHPSSIPLLGGLTPKFLSLSFYSLQGLLMLMASRIGTLWTLGNLIDLELNLYSIESNEGVTTNIIIVAP
jgi:hypothetical protein